MITDITVFDNYVLCLCDDVLIKVPKYHYDRALMTIIHCSLDSLICDFEGVIVDD